MQCLKCKKKMQTRRTRSEIGKVYRERYCPKCRISLSTTEEPNSIISLRNEEMQERIYKMTDLYEDTLRELCTYQDVILDLAMLIKKTKT